MVITGVIRPPQEIRVVADRTASYVAKNGRTFEARILNSAKGKTPKFAFLQPTSPFHAYYEDRIKFYENGGEDGAEQEQPTEKPKAVPVQGTAAKVPTEETSAIQQKKKKTQKASAIDPIAKALLQQRAKISQAKAKQKDETQEGGHGSETQQGMASRPLLSIPAPPPMDLVTIVAPSNLSAAQIETIQLVAQFAAMDGKGGTFLHQLTAREWNNSEFSFCQPRHPHFAYFSALVDAYIRVIRTWTAASSSRKPDDVTKQPPKTSIQDMLDEAAYRAEYEQEMEQLRSEREDGELVVIDWHDFVVVETIEFPVDEKVELVMLPPPPPPPRTSAQTQSATAKPDTEAMEESDDDEEETIRVVPSYTPKVVGTTNPQAARAIDPITGKSVPVADISEHMRIQSIDPAWAEERKKFQNKQKDSNLVGGDDIVNNLSRFSQAKGDLFGKSEQELLDKEKLSKRNLEEANRIIRNQATMPQPNFPSMTPTSASVSAAGEPSAKRTKLEQPPVANTTVPPPPPPVTMAVAPPLPPPPPRAPPGFDLPGIEDNFTPSNSTGAEGESTEKKLLSEAEFAASLPRPDVTLQVRIPNDPTQIAWNFFGQILSITVNVMTKVKEVKADFSRLHLNGMPVNKMQFKDANSGFLKDNMTLAALNIGPTATLEMVPKTRGGRR